MHTSSHRRRTQPCNATASSSGRARVALLRDHCRTLGIELATLRLPANPALPWELLPPQQCISHSTQIQAAERTEFSLDITDSARHRAAPGDSQGVQLVHRLVLVGPLEVHLDLPHQWQAVGVGDVQLLRLVDAVFLTITPDIRAKRPPSDRYCL